MQFDWLSISKHLLLVSAIYNFICLSAILAGLFLIKKWIKDELDDGQRRWRCSVDDNFVYYFVLLLLLTIAQAAVSLWISTADKDEFSGRIKSWGFGNHDDFLLFFIAILV